jgi:hypothetical protein
MVFLRSPGTVNKHELIVICIQGQAFHATFFFLNSLLAIRITLNSIS